MNISDFITYQGIGIYYKNRKWAENLFKKIIDDLPKEIIKIDITSKYNLYIELKDETHIRFVSVDNSARGYRFTKMFLEPGINKEYYDCIIRPYLRPNYPIILDENLKNADIWYANANSDLLYENTQDEGSTE